MFRFRSSPTEAAASDPDPAVTEPEQRGLDPVATGPSPVPRTRAGAAWVAACAAALVSLGLIIFIVQNTASVRVSFLGLHGSLPLAAALLAAALAGAALALVIGTTRIAQLRRLARGRHD